MPDGNEDSVRMLFVPLDITAVSTHTEVFLIMQQLNNLMPLMEEEGSNIKKFNICIRNLIRDLEAHHITVPIIVVSLFLAYTECEDSSFVKYMDKKQTEYEKETLHLDNRILMNLTHKQYMTLIHKKQWKQKTKQELDFIVMFNQLQPNATLPGGKQGGFYQQQQQWQNRTDQQCSYRLLRSETRQVCMEVGDAQPGGTLQEDHQWQRLCCL